jgi:uncharacterized membrane protein YcaP (DUF421 family)
MEIASGIVLRVAFFYLYVLAMLRFSGKRSIDSLSPLDFIIALIIVQFFEDFVWGIVPVSQAAVAVGTLIFLHTLVSFGEAHVQRIHWLVTGRPTPVIDHGLVLQPALRRERTPQSEVWSQLREQGHDRLEDIRAAAWEPSGHLSVQPTEAARPARKRDLPGLKDRLQP